MRCIPVFFKIFGGSMLRVNKFILMGLISASCFCLSTVALAENYYDEGYQHRRAHDQNYGGDPYYSHKGYRHPYSDDGYHVRKTQTKPSKQGEKKQKARKRNPVPEQIEAPGRKTIKISLSNLTWAAYTPEGDLLKSGPISGGKDYCPDIGRSCRTPTGTYTIYSKKGEGCKSSKFPINKGGGAKMPYCMHFKGGFAMHGSNSVPGHHASHGCVRMPVEDARWLNQEFVNVGSTRVKITY